jgi:hypothetical protein
MFPMRALAHLRPPVIKLPDLHSNPYLLEARRRLERLAAVDLSRPAALSKGRWAEAQRWRLGEAWYTAQSGLQTFERQLRAQSALAGVYLSAAPPSLEVLRAAVLTHYCANILRYQAALGKRPGVPARPVPAEWVQMAAAAAIVSVIQAALMIWVLNRRAGRPAPARRRPACRVVPPAPVHAYIAPRAVCLPLRL